MLALCMTFTNVFAEAETKKVCNTTKDAKTGKEKEVCKIIKIHKKLDVKTGDEKPNDKK